MYKYNFNYDDIMPLCDVIKEGILFDDEKFSFESYWESGVNHYERLFCFNEIGEKEPFTGMIYEIYPSGDLKGNSFYKNGYEEGQDVDFYENGNISRYKFYNKITLAAFVIKWFENGNMVSQEE